MKNLLIFSLIVIASFAVIILQILPDDDFKTYLENSVPFVGTEIPRQQGTDGEGIVVAIIDTGVDFTHPDLLGWGPEGKVIGGYNFINEDQPPMDNNGHGTQVAGVIAADGSVTGIAPKAKILAYKVSEDGEGVSSDLIIKAIERAIEDGADVINISLGVNKTNARIESAVTKALDKEIFVVTAAGNDGPKEKSIGSPGRNYGSVTVGATYNNLTSSLVATLEVRDKPYTVIPMIGSSQLEEPINSDIVFGGYGREKDLSDVNTKDTILLVERGSDDPEELLYFSIKEKNAANAGAMALIVYNNKPGIFLGELLHEFTEPDYNPRIPVVSISREDGLEIKKIIEQEHTAILHLFYNPDYVAHFSSRGPVSPFYIKPDIVAPGAYINTTQINGGYNFTSGTSYAAPHVSGAAALLFQKNHGIHHHQVKSLLLTTAEPVSDAYGNLSSISEAGTGRLNVAKASKANLVIEPPHFIVNLSSEKKQVEKQLSLQSFDGKIGKIDVSFEGPQFIRFDSILEKDNLDLRISADGEEFGDYEGRIRINHEEINYTVPFLIHYTEGSVSVEQEGGKLLFDVQHPHDWNFAKISVTNSRNGETEIISTNPTEREELMVYENGEYWIQSNILIDGNSYDAFEIVHVNSVPEGIQRPIDWFDLPAKQVGIISVIIAIVGIVGFVIKRRTSEVSAQRF